MFKRVCSLEDLWEGDMETFEVNGRSVLLVYPEGGTLYAVQGMCPHQQIPLDEGTLEGSTLTCRAHLWKFDVTTGKGINPEKCRRTVFPLRIEGQEVLVDTDGIEEIREGV